MTETAEEHAERVIAPVLEKIPDTLPASELREGCAVFIPSAGEWYSFDGLSGKFMRLSTERGGFLYLPAPGERFKHASPF